MTKPRFEPIAMGLARRVSAISLIPKRGIADELRDPYELAQEQRWANFVECHGALLGAARQLLGAPQFSKLSRLFDEFQSDYQAEGPPHSPVYEEELTQLILGQIPEGMAAETPLSVVASLTAATASRAFLAPLARSMADSHWELYRVTDCDGQRLKLQSIRSGNSRPTTQASCWLRSGDGVLARVLSFGELDYLKDPPYLLLSSETDWQDYLSRVEPPSASGSSLHTKRPQGRKGRKKRKVTAVSIDRQGEHLRRGKSPHFWLDYIVAAYAGERDGVVCLQGVPDRPDSLPHQDLPSEILDSPGK